MARWLVYCDRDAEDAVRARDGYDFYGQRLRVELAKGQRDRGPRGPPGVDVRPRGTGFRVTVKGLPLSASWQDLKVRRGASQPAMPLVWLAARAAGHGQRGPPPSSCHPPGTPLHTCCAPSLLSTPTLTPMPLLPCRRTSSARW